MTALRPTSECRSQNLVNHPSRSPFKAIFVGTLFQTLALFSTPSGAAIYGKDDRHEVFESKPEVQQLAKSVASRITKASLGYDGDINKTCVVHGKSLGATHCPSVHYAEQIRLGGESATGFLVKEDILVTAGHSYCTETEGICNEKVINQICQDYVWIFDYKLKNAGDTSYTSIPGKNIYSCKKVLAHKRLYFDDIDYTIVQLDRKVEGRKPLTMDLSNPVSVGLPLFVIGYPSGLPQKMTDNGFIINNSNPLRFETDIDTFKGNSGSPVFNALNNKVIGIVSAGHADWVAGPPVNGKQCKVEKICTTTTCYTARMSSITNLKDEPSIK